MLRGQAAFCQGGTDLELGEAREFLPQLLQRRRLDILAHLLLKITDFQIISQLHASGKGWDKPQDAPKQGRLSDAVGSGQDDPFSPLHLEIQRGRQRLVVTYDQLMGFHQITPRRPGLQKMKFRLRLLRRQLNQLHLIQLFLPGHGHIPRGDPCLISRHKIFKLRDLLLLPIIGRLQLGLFHRVDLLEPVVIAHIAVQLLVVHMIDQIDDAVEKRYVMGNQDKRVFIIVQVPFQPLDMYLVQIVRRLVQKQNVRLLQKKFSKKHPGALASGQLRHIPVKAHLRQPQGPAHLLDLRVDQIEIMGGQKLLDHTGLFHIIGHFLIGSLRHLLIHRIHLRFQSKQELKSRRQHVPDGHALLQSGMLIQIAHPDIFRPFDPPLVRLQLPGDNIHKCGLSFPIGPHQPNMLSLQQPEGHIMKNSPVSKAVGQVFYSQNTHLPYFTPRLYFASLFDPLF